MAEDRLPGAAEVVQIEPDKPKRAPPSSEENREAPSIEEPRPEKALVEALRGFIRHESGQIEAAPPKTIGPSQAIALVLFAVDVAFIYSQFETWLENPFFRVALKVVPWVLGATAVGYADKVRRFMLEQARHMKRAIIATAFLVPLLILLMPVFSLQIRSGSATVKPDDTRVGIKPHGNGLYRLVFPRLYKYRISVTGPPDKPGSVTYPMWLGRFRILQGTLAQIPLIGSFSGPEEVPLGPLYSVPTESKGNADVTVEGQFQEGFFQEESLATAGCQPAKPTKAGRKAVHCHVEAGGGGFVLPSGWYDFTLIQDGCRKLLPSREVKAGENDLIDFDQLCSK